MGTTPRQDLAEAFSLQRAGRLPQAEAKYAAYLAVFPEDSAALNNAAAVALKGGDVALAISRFEKLIALAPGQAHVWNNLGFALIQAGRPDEAIERLTRAIALDDRYATAYNNLGIAYEQIDCRPEAIAAFECAFALDPRYADAAANLADVFTRDDDSERARSAARRALAIDAEHLGARVALAMADALDGDLDGARAALETLALEKPQFVAFWRSLGVIRLWAGDFEGAEDASRRALTLDPNERPARFVVAASLLARGDYAHGWRAFEERPTGISQPYRRFREFPGWTGERLEGTLLVVCEHGLGDIVQFARFLPEARTRVGEVVFLADRQWQSLAPLLSRMSGVDRLLTDEAQVAALPERPAAVVSVLSLPLLLNIEPGALPGAMPYLSAPPDYSTLWKPRLAALARPRVGLVWATYAPHHLAYVTRQKTIPLQRLAPLFATPGVSFVSLQLGAPGALSTLGDLAGRVADFTPDIRDFGDTAAIIAELDLVISADTSVAHVAGAMGKPVWMIDRFNTCWRWYLAEDSSPWYPSMRIFRQERFGDWSTPIARVAAALRELKGPD